MLTSSGESQVCKVDEIIREAQKLDVIAKNQKSVQFSELQPQKTPKIGKARSKFVAKQKKSADPSVKLITQAQAPRNAVQQKNVSC